MIKLVVAVAVASVVTVVWLFLRNSLLREENEQLQAENARLIAENKKREDDRLLKNIAVRTAEYQKNSTGMRVDEDGIPIKEGSWL